MWFATGLWLLILIIIFHVIIAQIIRLLFSRQARQAVFRKTMHVKHANGRFDDNILLLKIRIEAILQLVTLLVNCKHCVGVSQLTGFVTPVCCPSGY